MKAEQPLLPSCQPNSITRRSATPHQQRGTVLVVSLILLLVMTLLGVTALNITSMEEKMAANIQEVYRAFEAAETGLTEAFTDPNAFASTDPDVVVTTNTIPIGTAGAIAQTSYLGSAKLPVGSLWSQDLFAAYHYETTVTGASHVVGGGNMNPAANSAQVNIAGGAFQIGKKP